MQTPYAFLHERPHFMLIAKPRHLFSYCYRIYRDDEELGSVKVSVTGRRGAIQVGPRELEIRKIGLLRPRFELIRGEEIVAQAEKLSLVRDRVRLILGSAACSLQRKGLICSRYYLWLADEQLGEIRRGQWYSRTAHIDLPEDWPVELRLFVFWIVAHFWRRDAAAAGGSG